MTRPFRYDLNQIPYDYTVEVRNRFKGLNLIECLMNYGQRFVTVQETGKVVLYSYLFKNFPQFVVTPTVKGFSIVGIVNLYYVSILWLKKLRDRWIRQPKTK